MKKNDNLAKTMTEWKKLAQPNKRLFFIALTAYIMHKIALLLDTIFVANVTASLAVGDWDRAYMYLVIALFFLVFRNLILLLYRKYRAYIQNDVYDNIQGKIYNKLLTIDGNSVNKIGKEYILNTIGTSVNLVGIFEANLIYKIGSIVQVLISLIIVLQSSVLAGLMIMGIAVVNYLLLLPINKYLAHAQSMKYRSNDRLFGHMSDIIDGHDVIKEFNAKDRYKRRYMHESAAMGTATYHEEVAWCLKSDIHYAFYNCLISAATIYMVHLVAGGSISLTAYFVIVPYITSCTTYLLDIINVNELTENVKVAMGRVNTILNFDESEMQSYGNINSNKNVGNISFVDVSFLDKNVNSDYNGVLYNVDMSFKDNDINIVRGGKRCGKRIIFNMLRRNIKPDKGLLMIDNINAREYSAESYANMIYYTVREPEFISGSIMDNLIVAEKSKVKIRKMCKEMGIYDYIMSLPKKFDTAVDIHLPRVLRYLIGMVRAMLSGSKALMIYELPYNLNNAEKMLIKHILNNIKQHRTVILFTHSDEYDDIAYLVYTMDSGKVVDIGGR